MGLLMGKFRQFLTELSACDTIMAGDYHFTFLFICSRIVNVFENTLATTVTELVIKELVKLKMVFFFLFFFFHLLTKTGRHTETGRHTGIAQWDISNESSQHT